MSDDDTQGCARSTDGSGRGDGRPVSVSTATLFEALADRRRRAVLTYLSESADGAASVRELSTAVGSRMEDAGSPEQVAVALHHTVLPKLADAGLVEYDPRSNTVRYWRRPELERVLAATRGE